MVLGRYVFRRQLRKHAYPDGLQLVASASSRQQHSLLRQLEQAALDIGAETACGLKRRVGHPKLQCLQGPEELQTTDSHPQKPKTRCVGLLTKRYSTSGSCPSTRTMTSSPSW